MINRWMLALVFVSGASIAASPTPKSAAAATATAADNRICNTIEPFYWEIGDATGTLVSGSEGVDSTGAAVVASTRMNYASSAKWIYAMYVMQVRGSAAKLTATDVAFLTMTSGYTNLGNDDNPQQTCPNTDSPDTVNVCLTRLNPANGLPYSYKDPATVGFFDYDGGHFENHAGLLTSLGNVPKTSLGPKIAAQLGSDISFSYTSPLIPGAINGTPATFAALLSSVVGDQLVMHDVLGIKPVCTTPSATCDALNSPIPEPWHYSIGHWVEDEPGYGDGAFSAPGGQGFYPWIEAGKTYYGLVGRAASGPQRQGFQSVQCGRLIRHAWDTGVQQTGRQPTG